MLQVRTQRFCRMITIERPTAWLVVGILVEVSGGITRVVSKPRVLKIIPKEATSNLLKGSVGNKAALSGFVAPHSTVSAPIRSPYANILFFNTSLDLITSQRGPRPPTI